MFIRFIPLLILTPFIVGCACSSTLSIKTRDDNGGYLHLYKLGSGDNELIGGDRYMSSGRDVSYYAGLCSGNYKLVGFSSHSNMKDGYQFSFVSEFYLDGSGDYDASYDDIFEDPYADYE